MGNNLSENHEIILSKKKREKRKQKKRDDPRNSDFYMQFTHFRKSITKEDAFTLICLVLNPISQNQSMILFGIKEIHVKNWWMHQNET